MTLNRSEGTVKCDSLSGLFENSKKVVLDSGQRTKSGKDHVKAINYSFTEKLGFAKSKDQRRRRAH